MGAYEMQSRSHRYRWVPVYPSNDVGVNANANASVYKQMHQAHQERARARPEDGTVEGLAKEEDSKAQTTSANGFVSLKCLAVQKEQMTEIADSKRYHRRLVLLKSSQHRLMLSQV